MEITKINFDALINKLILGSIDFVIALLIFIIGVWFAKKVSNAIEKAFQSRHLDQGLITFLRTPVYILIIIIVGTIALNRIGIQTTSFIAVLGTMGIAIGLAFKDYLTNFTSGFLILFLKPFKIGSYIEVNGVQGTVDEIRMLNTKIISPENKSIYIPNADLVSKPLTNHNENIERVIEFKFAINYNEDLKRVKKVVLEALKGNKYLIRKNEIVIGIWHIFENHMELLVRVWIKTVDFQDAKISLNEQIKDALFSNQILNPHQVVEVKGIKQGS